MSCRQDSQNSLGLSSTEQPIISEESDISHSTNHAPTVMSAPISRSIREHLLFWGKNDSLEGRCQITAINVDSLQTQETVLDQSFCQFERVVVHNREYLAQAIWHNPEVASETRAINLFDISNEGELVLAQSIPLGQVRITAVPQWGKGNTVYFSGILDGREQIYRIDPTIGHAEPYIDYSDDGFATEPIISPDGRYIAYRVWENHNSRDDCGQLTCYYNYYYIWDIQEKTTISLLPEIQPLQAGEPYFLHCDLAWSPDSQWIAFVVGCSLQKPGSVVIFDVTNRQPVSVINATSSGPYGNMMKYEWLTGNRLVLSGMNSSISENTSYEGYFAYSLEDNSFELWSHLNKRNKWDVDIVTYLDWTNDGVYALGQTQAPGDRRMMGIVIMNTNNLNDSGNYFLIDETNIQWLKFSPSEDWMAYVSYNQETQNSFRKVAILDRDGRLLYDSGVIPFAELTASWIMHD